MLSITAVEKDTPKGQLSALLSLTADVITHGEALARENISALCNFEQHDSQACYWTQARKARCFFLSL